MGGRELSQRFYAEVVAPAVVAVLDEAPHAAAMLGDGSPDHDFGPRVQLILPKAVDPAPLLAELGRLPTTYHGYPVYFGGTTSSNGWSQMPSVSTAGELFSARLGFDPEAGISLADWLTTPTQILATLTAGRCSTTRPGC